MLMLAVLGLVGLGVAAMIANRRHERRWRRLRIERQKPALKVAAQEATALLDRDRYLNARAVERWNRRHRDLGDLLRIRADDLALEGALREDLELCRGLMHDTPRVVEERNADWTARELRSLTDWFDGIEKRPLTERQREAVVRDEDNALVVAGAGTGKTSTVIGKIGYLLERGHARPEQILVLAFARKAKEELEERVKDRFGVCPEVRTFHGLGRSILGEADGRVPTLAKTAEDPKALDRLLEKIIDAIFEEKRYHQILVDFFSYHLRPVVDSFDFETTADYYRQLRQTDHRTLKGERVKSHEELLIANWLTANGIPYEYEAMYPVDTADARRQQYRPDFHLREHGIYIEHFGIGRDGSTAPHVDGEAYRAQMAWKRELHRSHGTELVETYSYERMDGKLFENLEARLRQRGVTPRPLSAEKLKQELQESSEIRRITQLIKRFLNLFRSHPTNTHELRRMGAVRHDGERCAAFLDVFAAVHERYEEHLRRHDVIDFHDMIAQAEERARCGKYVSPFTHIVVDEFQDISPGRVELLKALLAQADEPRLFCVGDDWQSIFRFTGSDISIMRRLEEHVGATRRTDLDRTFRFNDRILAASTRFITANPDQLKKEMEAARAIDRPAIKILLASSEESVDTPLASALREIAGETKEATVLLLARYNFVLDDVPRRLLWQHPHLSITPRTVHTAKGLEADYVVVLGVSTGKYGFPTGMADDPLLGLLLPGEGGYPNAEERRLFYVALTRARHRVFLLADDGARSCFLDELEQASYASLVEFAGGDHESAVCRRCHGRLVRRHGRYSTFWGCEHYPLCEGKGTTCPQCRRGVLVADREGARCNVGTCGYRAQRCGRCRDGFMLPKEGRFGPFWGCSSYPECTHTRSRDSMGD